MAASCPMRSSSLRVRTDFPLGPRSFGIFAIWPIRDPPKHNSKLPQMPSSPARSRSFAACCALIQLLLDNAPLMDTPKIAGRTHLLVLACRPTGQPDAASFLAERGAPLDLKPAAGIGKFEFVKRAFDADGQLKPPATQQQLQN